MLLGIAPGLLRDAAPHRAHDFPAGLGVSPGARCHLPAAVGRDELWRGCAAHAQRLSPAEETYTNITQKCWELFVDLMKNVTVSELCEWKVISRYRAVGQLESPPGQHCRGVGGGKGL